jgi:multicomponent Na+:H+ antiporter subunit F
MILDAALIFVIGFLSLAFVLAFIRFLIGPDITDRVVALDLIAMIIAAWIIAYMVLMNEPVFMDAVVIMALITFFGTVAFSRYLEKGLKK